MRGMQILYQRCRAFLLRRNVPADSRQRFGVRLDMESLEPRTVLSTMTAVDSFDQPNVSTVPVVTLPPASAVDDAVTAVSQADLPAWAENQLARDDGQFVSAFRGQNEAYVVHYTIDGAPEVLYRDARLDRAVSLVDFIEERLSNQGLDGLFGLPPKTVTDIRNLDVTANSQNENVLEISGTLEYENGPLPNDMDFVMTIMTSPLQEFQRTQTIRTVQAPAPFVGPLPIRSLPDAAPDLASLVGPFLSGPSQPSDRFDIAFFDALAPIAPEVGEDDGSTQDDESRSDEPLDRSQDRHRLLPDTDRRGLGRGDDRSDDDASAGEDLEDSLDHDIRDDYFRRSEVRDGVVQGDAEDADDEKAETDSHDAEQTDDPQTTPSAENPQSPNEATPEIHTESNTWRHNHAIGKDRYGYFELSPAAVDLILAELGRVPQSVLHGRARLELAPAEPIAVENSAATNAATLSEAGKGQSTQLQSIIRSRSPRAPAHVQPVSQE